MNKMGVGDEICVGKLINVTCHIRIKERSQLYVREN
jgi:hypothetical protein